MKENHSSQNAQESGTSCFTRLRSKLSFERMVEMGAKMGMENPLFLCHERAAKATTVINGKEYINFSTYDYLDLNTHPEITEAVTEAAKVFGSSAGASRLVGGERPPHRQLERALADFYGVEDCIAYVSGHATNVSTLGFLFGHRDAIFYDGLAHNSLMQGARLSGADRYSYEHNDCDALEKMLKDDREKYEKFFDSFGTQLKYGIYESFGANKENLQDLLMFKSSFGGYVTLEEYVSRMKDDQKYIYFASGSSIARIEALPQTEMVRDKGFEILYFTDHVDEFTMQMMHDYNGKEFKSVSADDLGLETDEEKEEIKKAEEDNKGLFDLMTEKLGGKVKAVKLSQRLKTHPVCITSEGMLSVEMEKVLSAMPDEQAHNAKAEKILEINASHPIFEKLKKLYAEDNKDKVGEYADILYSQALLIEGMPIENPVEFTNKLCEIMAE